MVNKKTIKILIIIFFTIVFYYTLFISIQKNFLIDKHQGEWTLLWIKDIQSPEQIIWYGNNFLIVKEGVIYNFNIKEINIEEFGLIKEGEVLGIYNDDIVYIQYENRTITKPTEFATSVKILERDSRVEIFSKDFHETIKPVYIEGDNLFLVDNYINSPGRMYFVGMEDGDIQELETKRHRIGGEESIIIYDEENKKLFEINKVNNISYFEINEEKTKVGLVDSEGNVWVYTKR